MATFQTIDDLGDLTGQTALVRVDLNVPMRDGLITDDTRIAALVPTVRDLRAKGAQIILLSHFGRPRGERRHDMSLEPLKGPLETALGEPVTFADDCIGAPVREALARSSGIVLAENLRFHEGEEGNDANFAAALAVPGDIVVADAFSCSHRAHASTEGLACLLPAYAGRSMAGELAALENALGTPERPVVAVVGGAKVSSKLDVLTNLVTRVDHLIIGGGMANTFLAALGIDVGKSLCEHDLADTARNILNRADDAGCTIHLPTDVVLAKEFKAGVDTRITTADDVHADEMILDVGPQAVAALSDVVRSCRTLIWNGPLGAFETSPFDAGTMALAKVAAAATDAGTLVSVAGGGDTVAALAQAGVKDRFGYVSTAGGAFLEWMEGKTLPGVKVLER